jgi:ABC-type glycerol-3-phosphate transport system substrate-binding protein
MKISSAALLFLFLIDASAWSQSTKAPSAADLASYTGVDRERLLVDGAKREGKLVWYTTLAAEQNKQIAGAFEAKYLGVKVETFRTGSSALAQRVLTEAKARRHIADAIETTLPGLLTFRDNQLLLPYTSPHLAAFPEDAKEKGPKNLVYWTNVRESFIGFAYNKNFLHAADVPKNFDGLIKPALRDNMGLSGDDTGARIIGAMLKAKGDGFVRKLKEQNIRMHMMAGSALTSSWPQEKSLHRRASFTALPTLPPSAERRSPGFPWIWWSPTPAARRCTPTRHGPIRRFSSPIFS